MSQEERSIVIGYHGYLQIVLIDFISEKLSTTSVVYKDI